MYSVNKYLVESPLTTTKNKFLKDICAYNLEECEPEWCKENKVLQKSLKRKLLLTDICHIEKFLKKDDFSKKKKKKRCGMYRSRLRCPAVRDIECTNVAYCESALDSMQESREVSLDESILRFNAPPVHSFTFQTDGTAPPVQSFAFGSVASAPVNNLTFGSAATVPADSCNLFGGGTAAPVLLRSATAAKVAPYAMFGSAILESAVVEKVILKMPTYELNVIELQEESEQLQFSLHPDDSSCLWQNSIANCKEKKLQLLNIVSMALMYSSDLKDRNDAYRLTLLKSADAVRLIDPEFILKVALYARQELQIRTVTNFLLSYSALYQSTRVYLDKYFNASIVLPTDWIEVAEFHQILSSEVQNQSFPAALRRIMKKTFSKFDKYQLAKYNRDRIKKKKNSKEQEPAKESSSSEDDEEKCETCDSEQILKKKVVKLTLKKLIRRLHINSPTDHVMCLLGKKYPESHAEFKACGLSGTWDPMKAGTRMKLPIPETWETQISANGNKVDIWESLIDNNKLPYMAMLRNLRNLILSGISPAHHMKVITYLEDKKFVIKSRQLPMQFFEAYKVIKNLEKEKELEGNEISPFQHQNRQSIPAWKKAHLLKIKKKIKMASIPILEQYKKAITNALEISSLNNLHPIPGKTLVICQIDAKQLNKSVKIKSYETCIMIGLMCLKACEDCKMNIISCSKSPDAILLHEKDQFLDVLLKTCEKYEKLFSDLCSLDYEDTCPSVFSLENILEYYLKPHAILSLKLDHIVFLQTSSGFENVMSSFLHKYRQVVNSELLYTNINFNLTNKSFSGNSSLDKDVYLCGSSSSLIKFIAERSSGGQLIYVENIDMKYNLEVLDLKKYSSLQEDESTESCSVDVSVPLIYKVPKWHTVRIFISSTFQDMMSERDLLVRYVFPELKRRAASIFIRIAEIDLRWGITEADSASERAAGICLTEAQKADLFVGFIGERYGTIYDFETPDASDLQWLNECPSGLSITELEIHAAALRNPESSQKKSFFYFRDSSFLRKKNVPGKWVSHFKSESVDSKMKVAALKTRIRSNNFKIFDGYPCKLAGIYENKPILGGLDILGNRVLDDLWNAIQEIHKTDPYCNSISEEEICQQNLINSQNFFIETKNSPKEKVIHQIKSEQGIFVICGSSGSGKTAFVINLLQSLKLQIVVKFFIGISSKSRDLCYMLHYICQCICHQLGILIPFPNSSTDIVNQFPDFLLEAANCCSGKDIILLIDGLDHLEKDDQRLDWLPLLLPNRVKLVCTASESSQAFRILCERQEHGNAIFFQELPPLLQSDREQFVREYLSYYRKILDETAFTNHMLIVVTRTESGNPFYLRLVCDFLRMYALFSNLVSVLQKLPSSTLLLFQEIILQMENEFGSTLVQTALTLLCITEGGLEDNDLHYILSFMHTNDVKTLPFDELKKKILVEREHFICQVKYCTLMHLISISAYGQLRQSSFSLVGTEFENAVKKFYINKNFSSHAKTLHTILAAYYYNMCDMKNDGRFGGQLGFPFRRVLYHMFHGSLYKELNDLLCNLRFLEAVFRVKESNKLLEYYSAILYNVLSTNQKVSREIDHYHLFSFFDFVSRNFHIFHQYPQLIMQQALNEPSESVVSLKKGCNYSFIENLSQSDILDYRIATLGGFVKNITASAGEKGKPIIILGSEDGYLKVLDLSTRRITRTFKGHACAITCICFVNKNRICASSVDTTLSLWNAEDFSRIAVLNGHRHNVTSCCSDPSGSILFSSGWDNSVRLWSLRDGRAISVIEDFRCPVSCIDHHPVKQEIACGLWNGNIEIWDTVSMQRKFVFSNFSGSVKSIAYTSDGVNIISSFIQSEISIWSSEEGLKISTLKGHILPVKSLVYSFDESLFISGSDDCTLKVWSAVHGSHFPTVSESKFCPVSLMEFLTENLLAATFQNSEIWIIDIHSGGIIDKSTLSTDAVSAISKYSFINMKCQDSQCNWFEKSLVFGTKAGKLMIKELSSSSFITKASMNSKITAVIHNCDIILCGTAEGDIGVFSYPDDKLTKVLFAAHKGFISSFCFSTQCGELFALSTANDSILKLWHVDWNNLDVNFQQELFSKHNDGITYSLFYPQSCDTKLVNNLLTGSHDNNIILWNENSIKMLKGLQSSVVNIARSGDYILGCGNDGAIVMWSHNGAVLTSVPGIELSSAILTFHVTEDDSDKFAVTLAFVDQDGSIKIRKPLQKTYCCSFDGHSKPITSCCTAENGEVVSCSLDGTVSLWKVPPDIPNIYFMHSTVITGLLLSSSLDFALSSDAHGNLLLWKIHLDTSAAPLIYAGKKSYNGGFIRALAWMKNKSIVCAVSQVIGSQEIYFLNIIHLNCSSVTETIAFSLDVKKSHHFESEILCLDSCPITDAIIVGLKSGDVMIITSKTERLIKMDDDWLLGLRFCTRKNTSDLFCTSYIDGSVKLFSVADFLNLEVEVPDTFAVYKPTSAYKGSKFTSSMCCGNDRLICCGDSEGILRIYSKHSLKFLEKIHDDSISGICIVGPYLFTSSLDKTVKGWNLNSLKQVYQFYSHAPICCMSSPQMGVDLSNSNCNLLLIGTTSGNVQLLKLHFN